MAQPAKNHRTSITMDWMKRELECSVCLKVPRQGYVYQCMYQCHCICSECQPRFECQPGSWLTCPTCGFAVIRNPAMEKSLSRITHGCKFSDQGCNFEDTPTPLGSHEKYCIYRVLNCTILACCWSIWKRCTRRKRFKNKPTLSLHIYL